MEKYTTNNAINALLNFLQEQSARQVVVLTDSNLDALYPHYLDALAQHFSVEKIVVPAGERHKSIEQATAIWQQLLENQYGKDLVIVNFGGGMVCDLGGFVAATYKRGVRCVNFPTTLLAMIDAAIGGKTAVNLSHVKNCVGLIRQPDFIVPADVELLKTLPQPELLSGFGELIKYALIASRPLFDELLQLDKLSAECIRPEWIATCVEYKNKIVAMDPEEWEYLTNSGITLPVKAISNPHFPLSESEQKNLLKLYLNDVGLLTGLLFDTNINAVLQDENSVNLGSVYESVVAQELHAHGFDLHYYDNKKKGEVDFLIDDFQNLTILPLEIKSGKDYTVHSALDNFLSTPTYDISSAIVFNNSREVKEVGKIFYMPIYYVMFLQRSVEHDDELIVKPMKVPEMY